MTPATAVTTDRLRWWIVAAALAAAAIFAVSVAADVEPPAEPSRFAER